MSARTTFAVGSRPVRYVVDLTSLATVAMHLSEYQKVDGVMVPHQIDISIDGRASEARTLDAVKINPKVKHGTFKKPTKQARGARSGRGRPRPLNHGWPDSRPICHMKAIWNGVVIAESADTVVVEGNHYFPPDAIKPEFFRASAKTTVCGWKGLASYYTVSVNGQDNPDAAWYYPTPKPEAAHVAGRVAFWKGVSVQP